MGCRQVLLLVLITLIIAFGSGITMVGAADSRMEEIYLDREATSSNPSNDGNFIVWMESRNTSTYPCYYNMQTGDKGIINPAIKVANGIRLRIDNGLVVYCNADFKELWCTNLSTVNRFGLEPGKSKKLLTTEKEIGHWAVSGGSIAVFAGGGILKDLYWLSPCADTILMKNVTGRDLYFYSSENQEGLLWVDKSSNKVYSYKLNQGTCELLQGLLAAYGMLDVWEDNLVFRNPDDGWQYFNLTSAKNVALPIAGVPGFSVDHEYLYYDKDSTIYKMNMKDKSESALLPVAGPIKVIDYCKGELVYKCINQPINWRAGVAELKIDLPTTIFEPGESVPLQAIAAYRNGFNETLCTEIRWNSNQLQVAEVENGTLLARRAGTAQISAEYEGMTAHTSIIVRELQAISILPDNDSPLQIGESLALTAHAHYSDGSSSDITREAVWKCSGNNEISPEGLFTAREEETTLITVTHAGITATRTIRIEALPQPSEPPAPDHPAPEPVLPVPAAGSSSSSSIQPLCTNPLLQALLTSNNNPLVIELKLQDNKIHFELSREILNLMQEQNREIHLQFPGGKLILQPGFIQLQNLEKAVFELCLDEKDKGREIFKSQYKSLQQISPSYTITLNSSSGTLIKLITPLYFQPVPDGLDPAAILYQYSLKENKWNRHPPVAFTGEFAYAINAPGEYSILLSKEHFQDSSEHWAAADIKLISELQLLPGLVEGCFEPDHPIDRDTFFQAVEQLFMQNGSLQGLSAGCTSVTEYFDREEMAVMLYRGLKNLEDLAIPALLSTTQASYKDNHQISAASRPAVEVLTQLGLIQGTDQNQFNPHQLLTRAEAAAILHRLYNLLQTGQLSSL